jgi:hypothetical protein
MSHRWLELLGGANARISANTIALRRGVLEWTFWIGPVSQQF